LKSIVSAFACSTATTNTQIESRYFKCTATSTVQLYSTKQADTARGSKHLMLSRENARTVLGCSNKSGSLRQISTVFALVISGHVQRTGQCPLGARSGHPPSHSTVSSARSSSGRNTLRPSVLAVLRLITSSNFTGCSMGKSAGFAPFKTFFTTPTRRFESKIRLRADDKKRQ